MASANRNRDESKERLQIAELDTAKFAVGESDFCFQRPSYFAESNDV